MKTLLALTAICLGLAGMACAQALDAYGNALGPVPGGLDDPPGTVLNKYPAPTSRVAGLTMIGTSLYVISYPSSSNQILYELDAATGTLKSTLTLPVKNYYGLGHDTRRNEFVLCSPATSPASLIRMNLNGTVTTTWAAPSARPIGVAYDFRRDAYWVPDWSINFLYLLDATNGQVLRSFDLRSQGVTRAADCGYSDVNDLVYINARNQNAGALLDPTTGKVTTLVPHPGGTNVGQGAVLHPRLQAPISGNWNGGANQTLYTYELGLPRAAGSLTVKVGTTLSLKWIASADPSRTYKGAAALSEGAIPLGNRVFPLTLDALFGLSLQGAGIFVGFGGTLDTSGEAAGGVVVPNVPPLVGIQFFIAFVTLDPGAPLGISHISGARQTVITS